MQDVILGCGFPKHTSAYAIVYLLSHICACDRIYAVIPQHAHMRMISCISRLASAHAMVYLAKRTSAYASVCVQSFRVSDREFTPPQVHFQRVRGTSGSETSERNLSAPKIAPKLRARNKARHIRVWIARYGQHATAPNPRRAANMSS